jgi:hypothetical protein
MNKKLFTYVALLATLSGLAGCGVGMVPVSSAPEAPEPTPVVQATGVTRMPGESLDRYIARVERMMAEQRQSEEAVIVSSLPSSGSEPPPVRTQRPAPRPVPKRAPKPTPPPPPLATAKPPVSEMTEVSRYPAIESPDQATVGESITVMVSLAESNLTPEVVITQGKQDEAGRLLLALPELPDKQDEWSIDVVLSASGFNFSTPNRMKIRLPQEGNSTPAMFELVARESSELSVSRNLYATFWHEGQYLARVMKPIEVVKADHSVASGCQASTTQQQRGEQQEQLTEEAMLAADRMVADLTIYMRRDWDSCSSRDYFITLSSPHLPQPESERIRLPEDMNLWLLPKYQMFATTGRGISRLQQKSAVNEDALNGFGRLMYDKFAPETFKAVYHKLRDQLGEQFRTIQVFTDDPVIPWELMVTDGDGAQFLGMRHAVGRWIISRHNNPYAVPRQTLSIGAVSVVAPSYTGALSLSKTQQEAEYIQHLASLNPALAQGDYSSVRAMVTERTASIIHFAGHGYATRDTSAHATDYGIILEDSKLQALSWRGMLQGQSNSSLVFFNACEVGYAERAAGFVDGWSSALIDTGATGFISGLWELGDEGAAEFSRNFYQQLSHDVERDGYASVADIIRQSRQQFASTGNPTYLAYVFYGDANLLLDVSEDK